jgi:hypothetical protein
VRTDVLPGTGSITSPLTQADRLVSSLLGAGKMLLL